ncbi:MAG: hypothetical protein QOH88_1453 [Verrucomicrobiota bacterium]|jgi:hypothetical protein
MTLNITHKFAIAAVCTFALGSYAIAAGHGNGGGNSMSTGHGNSAFGMSQSSTRGNPQTGSGNSAFGKTTSDAARARSDRDEDIFDDNDSDLTKIKKVKKAKVHSTVHGNSAFGHRQGDALTRTRGSQNNAYGKTQSAKAKTKHTSVVKLKKDRDND